MVMAQDLKLDNQSLGTLTLYHLKAELSCHVSGLLIYHNDWIIIRG